MAWSTETIRPPSPGGGDEADTMLEEHCRRVGSALKRGKGAEVAVSRSAPPVPPAAALGAARHQADLLARVAVQDRTVMDQGQVLWARRRGGQGRVHSRKPRRRPPPHRSRRRRPAGPWVQPAQAPSPPRRIVCAVVGVVGGASMIGAVAAEVVDRSGCRSPSDHAAPGPHRPFASATLPVADRQYQS